MTPARRTPLWRRILIGLCEPVRGPSQQLSYCPLLWRDGESPRQQQPKPATTAPQQRPPTLGTSQRGRDWRRGTWKCVRNSDRKIPPGACGRRMSHVFAPNCAAQPFSLECGQMVDTFIKFIHINHVLLFRLFVCFFSFLFSFHPHQCLGGKRRWIGRVGWVVGRKLYYPGCSLAPQVRWSADTGSVDFVRERARERKLTFITFFSLLLVARKWNQIKKKKTIHKCVYCWL